MTKPTAETVLPPHNPILRGLYALLILAMFALGFIYARENYIAYEGYSYLSDYELHPSERRWIIGISETFSYLEGDFSAELEQLWARFYESEDIGGLLSSVANPARVYAVYDSFDESTGSFRATIGYESEPFDAYGELQWAEVYAGQYAVFASYAGEFSMSMAWEALALDVGIEPIYYSDFEIYDLDSAGEVISHELWVGAAIGYATGWEQ